MQGPPAIPDLAIEDRLLRAGARTLAGVDEAGRGCWAGPVYAAAVVLEARVFGDRTLLARVTDSKLLAPRVREELFHEILATAHAVSVAWVEARIVDSEGIVAATLQAMLTALDRLPIDPDSVLVDSLALPPDSEYQARQVAFDHADRLCLSVAAASICAKVSRDRDMRARAGRYPGYGFETNAGYGTPAHRRGLDRIGPCPIHRRSFKPVKVALAQERVDARLVS